MTERERRAGPTGSGAKAATRFRAVVAVAVVVVVATTCSSGTGGTATTSTPSGSAEATIADYAVGKGTIELVDRSRPTDADPNRNRSGRPHRTIPVAVLYPAQGTPEANADPVENAAVAGGEFPLVVFSHGWTVSGTAGA